YTGSVLRIRLFPMRYAPDRLKCKEFAFLPHLKRRKDALLHYARLPWRCHARLRSGARLFETTDKYHELSTAVAARQLSLTRIDIAQQSSQLVGTGTPHCSEAAARRPYHSSDRACCQMVRLFPMIPELVDQSLPFRKVRGH